MKIEIDDINQHTNKRRIYYSNDEFSASSLPSDFVELVQGQREVDIEIEPVFYMMMVVMSLDTNEVLLTGRLVKVTGIVEPVSRPVIPQNVKEIIYFNADHSQPNHAYIRVEGVTQQVSYTTQSRVRKAVNHIEVLGERYVQGNGESILIFETPVEVSGAVSIFAKVITPKNSTGTSFSVSDPVLSSYVSGTINDAMFSFGANGTSLYSEKDGLTVNVYSNNKSQMDAAKEPVVALGYIPRLDTGNGTFIVGILNNVLTRQVRTEVKTKNTRFEGILGGLRGGIFGNSGALRSLLVLQGDLTETEILRIARAMELE